MMKTNSIPESIHELTYQQLIKVVNWDGEIIADLVESLTGWDYDICLTWCELAKPDRLDFLINGKLIDTLQEIGFNRVRIDDRLIETSKDLRSDWFGKKMLAAYAYDDVVRSENKELAIIEALPKIIAIYCDYYKEFYPEGFDYLIEKLMQAKAADVYLTGIELFNRLAEEIKWQTERLTIPEGYQTEQNRKIKGYMDSAGVERLEKFGDMNLIDSFCETFPAYKHDDVFKLEFGFVVERMERIAIIENVKDIINQRNHDEISKKK